MACPFFVPSVRLAAGSASPPPRLPLGDPYAGQCQARPEEPFEPSEAILRNFCNVGYARGRCRHFPEGHPADAVRFSVTAPCVENDEIGHVKLVYIIEQYHAPLEYGALEYASANRAAVASAGSASLTESSGSSKSSMTGKLAGPMATHVNGSQTSDHGQHGIWIGSQPPEPLASQARAFVENYLSRKRPTEP